VHVQLPGTTRRNTTRAASSQFLSVSRWSLRYIDSMFLDILK